ncbi:hypothetical protein TNCV_2578971 [Trichonephila clavipes]|nr:hypothetical protein TNCV_2578971 [Trichonephila clavipes]
MTVSDSCSAEGTAVENKFVKGAIPYKLASTDEAVWIRSQIGDKTVMSYEKSEIDNFPKPIINFTIFTSTPSPQTKANRRDLKPASLRVRVSRASESRGIYCIGRTDNSRPGRERRPVSEEVVADITTGIVHGSQGTIIGTPHNIYRRIFTMWNIPCDMLRTVVGNVVQRIGARYSL